ncbi:MAG: hypothetical protein NC409_14340 [Clostridium sp.]|nr:hypothetical protein [Clostridium sp.]
MNRHQKKQQVCILLLAFCLLFSGCAQKQTGQELLDGTIGEEADARRIVELLLEKRDGLMQTIGDFSSEEELLSALEEVYTTEAADTLYEGWLCQKTYGLYEKSDDGALIRKEDAQLPAVFTGYDVSILSYSGETAEAFVIDLRADLSGSERGDTLETVELLTVTKGEQGFRLDVCRSGAIRRNYFSEEEEQAQPDASSEAPSEEEAYGIVKELFEKWTDYEYRFYVMDTTPGAELFTFNGYGEYAPYPAESFSSMEDLLAQLGEIMTQGCARQFQSIWLEREYPYYLEQDGVLYRVDAIVPEMRKYAADAIVINECGPESIHAFVIGDENEYDEFRSVYEFFLIKTGQGWRAEQIHEGELNKEDERPAYVIF